MAAREFEIDEISLIRCYSDIIDKAYPDGQRPSGMDPYGIASFIQLENNADFSDEVKNDFLKKAKDNLGVALGKLYEKTQKPTDMIIYKPIIDGLESVENSQDFIRLLRTHYPDFE